RPRTPRGMQVTFIVDVRRAWGQLIRLDRAHLAGCVLTGRLDECPVGHLCLSTRLAIYRPGGAMIVRRTCPGIMIHMGQDTEAQLGILIENFALWHVVSKVSSYEGLVLQNLLEQRTHLLTPARSGIGREDAVTLCSELFKGITHITPP